MENNNIQEILDKSKVLKIEVTDELKKSFISYAMAVNVSRAIPDVRDGLKPVHRRILYAMNEIGNTYDKPHKKCARIVGEVLGKYHPHGDLAVYDALVRLAQPFSIRHILIDGHGNFGSIDGDSPAAMRYTEARMSSLAVEMLRDIDKNTVDTYPNFDDTLSQPRVLPARFPNLLVNGADGIAVGMATSIPPHNLGEVIDATVAYLDNEEIEIEDLIDYIPAPDFPTGGIIMGISGIRKAYKTGRGTTILRAKVDIEEFNNNTRHRIVINELPYQVNKENLVKTIHELAVKDKIEGVSSIQEESDREGMRVVIEVKKGTDPNYVLNQLYKHTNMQISVSMILLALVDGKPKVLNLKEILSEYIKHQKNVVTRRTQYDLDKALEREHILKGLVIALANVDEVIKIIKESKDTQSAQEALMSNFNLTERQSFAILEMKLRRLTSLEVEKIQNELEELEKTINYYRQILDDANLLKSIIKTEILEIKRKYADERRTQIELNYDEIDSEDLIEREDIIITVSHEGYIKRLPLSEYKTQRRGGKGVIGQKTKEEDYVESIIMCNTHDQLLFFSTKGRVYRMKAYKIPEAVKTSKGRAIINVINFMPDEKLATITPYKEDHEGYVMLITKKGKIKKTDIKQYENINRNGKIAISLQEDDELIGVRLTSGDNEIIIATYNGQILRIHEKTVRPQGRTSHGVRAVRLTSEDDRVVDIAVVDENKYIFTITEKGIGKLTNVEGYRLTSRGAKGVKAGNYSDEATGRVAGVKLVSQSDEVLLITNEGIVIRTSFNEVNVLGRASKGVIIKRCNENEIITSVAIIPGDEEIDNAIELSEKNNSNKASIAELTAGDEE